MIEAFGWGMLGAVLLDLVRWAERLRAGNHPRTRAGWVRQLAASALLFIAGGGTAIAFGAVVEARHIFVAIGAGAPGVVRAMARSKMAERILPEQIKKEPNFWSADSDRPVSCTIW